MIMNLPKAFLISSVLFIFLLLSAQLVFSKDFGWEFEGLDKSADWSAQGAKLDIEGGSLNLSNIRFAKVNSKRWLKVPETKNMVRFKVESTKETLIAFKLLSERTWWAYERVLSIKEGTGEYSFFIEESLPVGERLSFVLLVDEENLEMSFDFIRFGEPTFFERAATVWGGFWNVGWINFETVNNIKGPQIGHVKFAYIFYIFLPLFFIVFVIFAISIKEKFSKTLLIRSLAFSFLFAGLIYAVRMDYDWLKKWQNEIGLFSGMDIDTRVVSMYSGIGGDDLFVIVGLIKENVPKGSPVRPLRNYGIVNKWLARYYLLPVMTSDETEYIWTLNDKDISYSASRRTLKLKGRLHASSVELIAAHNKGTALYRVAGGGKR
jgi:hypothetical protein